MTTPTVRAEKAFLVPGQLRTNIDYATRTDGNPVYIGVADKGLSDSADGWHVQYITYDTSGNILTVKSAEGSWDNRATLSYS